MLSSTYKACVFCCYSQEYLFFRITSEFSAEYDIMISVYN